MASLDLSERPRLLAAGAQHGAQQLTPRAGCRVDLPPRARVRKRDCRWLHLLYRVLGTPKTKTTLRSKAITSYERMNH